MTTREHLDRLTVIVETLAASVTHHDDQIEGLIVVAEKHSSQFAKHADLLVKHAAQMAAIDRRLEMLAEAHGKLAEAQQKLAASQDRTEQALTRAEQLWQAYLMRLPPH